MNNTVLGYFDFINQIENETIAEVNNYIEKIFRKVVKFKSKIRENKQQVFRNIINPEQLEEMKTNVLNLQKKLKKKIVLEENNVTGQRESNVIYRLPDGSTYEGDYLNNKKNGKGTLNFSDGAVYKGEFLNDKYQGHGTLELPDGTFYDGYWVMSKKQGIGFYRWADGLTYEGQWFNDERHGKGKETRIDGTTYEGSWEYSRKHGQFMVQTSEGRVLYERWERGIRIN